MTETLTLNSLRDDVIAEARNLDILIRRIGLRDDYALVTQIEAFRLALRRLDAWHAPITSVPASVSVPVETLRRWTNAVAKSVVTDAPLGEALAEMEALLPEPPEPLAGALEPARWYVVCPSCGRSQLIDDNLVWTRSEIEDTETLKCHKCGVVFVVPALPSEEAS